MHTEWVNILKHKVCTAVEKSEAPVSIVQSDVRIHDQESSRRRGNILKVIWRKKKIIEELARGKH